MGYPRRKLFNGSWGRVLLVRARNDNLKRHENHMIGLEEMMYAGCVRLKSKNVWNI